MFVNQLFQNERGGHIYGHTGVMAFHQRIVIGHSGFLRSARNTVEVGDESYHRFTAPIRRHPGGGDAGNFALDVEAVLLEDARNVARRLEFLKAKFAETENLIDHLLSEGLELVNFLDRFLF
jgi:hypothetical protein